MTRITAILLLCFLFVSFAASAQTLRAYEKAADEAYDKADYYNAVYYYELVLKSKQKPGIYYKYAEACRQSYAYKKAEGAYKKVIGSKDKNRYDKVEFYYAMTLKHNAKYDEAAIYFSNFISSAAATETYYKEKAEQELKSCAIAKELFKNPSDTVKINRLGDNVNTEYSDFAAHEIGAGHIYYSSLRFERKPRKDEKEPEAKRMISKMLESKNVEILQGVALPGLNTADEHSANSTLSADGKRLYFTRCSGQNNDSVVCRIYLSRMQENKSWSRPQLLPAPLNLANYTHTQPHVVFVDGSEWLYFASNRPGGLGGTDIWVARLLSDTLAEAPVNLGNTINTIDNEASPFYHPNSKRLYFASQWHLGLGGYDIFYSEKMNDSWSAPQNLGVPINSAANDLYWVLNKDDSSGYFASNRSGSMTITEESCCNDIYKFSYLRKISPLDTPVTVIDTIPTFVQTDIPNKTDKNNPGDGGKTEVDKKIEQLNNMLPLRLYFHNDEPDSNVTTKLTNKPYELPYQHYITLQESYVMEHAGQFDVEKRILVTKKINDFFEFEVKGEYARMNAFYEAILVLLEAGVKLEVKIKGYTSPRSYEGYNVALAHRRISAVRKQFFIYKKGIFLQYFQKGLLDVTELPLGESTAPAGISDDFNDPKNSIYSVEASRERRAEIVILLKK